MQPKTGSQAVKRKPKSESLFEELCVKHGIALTRLDPPHDLKWPDYELNFGDKLVVAEVKQIDPNEHDKQHGKALERNEIVYQCRNPDSMAKRVRNAIGKSTRQISSFLKYRNLAVPSILILFDHANNGRVETWRGGTKCSVSTSRSSNRTGGFPASGSRRRI